MNTKQLFFISLIILSIAMGLNWFKNRPKTVKKAPSKTRQAVNLDDLQLKDNEEDKEENEEEKKNNKQKTENKDEDEDDEEVDEEGEEENEEENDDEQKDENQTSQKEQSAVTSDESIIASGTISIEDNPLKDDPIMQDYFKITRNPFETSPYAQLVEKLRLEAELANLPEEKEEVNIPIRIDGNFSATIETNRGPKAIIDGNLYEKGDEYRGYKILEIEVNLIRLEKENTIGLLPKTGVNVDINPESGEYTIEDKFE